MINHNSNLIEAVPVFNNAGSGSIYGSSLLINLYADDFTGIGAWPNRTGLGDITTSGGTFTDSGSLGWGFSGGATLLLSASVALPVLSTTGFTCMFAATMGTSDNTKQTPLLQSLTGTYLPAQGYTGHATFYNPTGSVNNTLSQNGTQPGGTYNPNLPNFPTLANLTNPLSTLYYYSVTYYPSSNTVFVTEDDRGYATFSPYAGNSFWFNLGSTKFGGNGGISAFGTFAGSLQRMVFYNRPLTAAQIINNLLPALKRGA
jgi:hypothetical protein